jgi:prevent-host-death family protein
MRLSEFPRLAGASNSSLTTPPVKESVVLDIVRTYYYYVRMKVTTTELRQNLYRIIDSVLETGEPVEVVRKGRAVRIVPETKTSIWDRLETHDIIAGEIEGPWEGIWDGEPEIGLPGDEGTPV